MAEQLYVDPYYVAKLAEVRRDEDTAKLAIQL